MIITKQMIKDAEKMADSMRAAKGPCLGCGKKNQPELKTSSGERTFKYICEICADKLDSGELHRDPLEFM